LGAGFTLPAALEYRGLRTRHAVASGVFLVALLLFVPFGLSARYAWAGAPLGVMIVRRSERTRERAVLVTPAAGAES
jgi:hypothetical protein